MALPDYLPGRFALARGRPSDYFALEHFHYLPQRPATYADVWVVRFIDDDARPLASPALRGDTLRFAQHDALDAHRAVAMRRDAGDDDDDPRAWRVVAVAVLSYPTIRSSPRERTLGLRDAAPRDRAAYVNAHVRTISRVVVHPQFRGLGLASELVRKLIAVCPTRYVEAAAVMAHVHPFFAAAGMRQSNVEDVASQSNHNLRPAYFIVDKQEGGRCER
jgi:ribosomal protein S18 acetylase RimI-like enzyme